MQTWMMRVQKEGLRARDTVHRVLLNPLALALTLGHLYTYKKYSMWPLGSLNPPKSRQNAMCHTVPSLFYLSFERRLEHQRTFTEEVEEDDGMHARDHPKGCHQVAAARNASNDFNDQIFQDVWVYYHVNAMSTHTPGLITIKLPRAWRFKHFDITLRQQCPPARQIFGGDIDFGAKRSWSKACRSRLRDFAIFLTVPADEPLRGQTCWIGPRPDNIHPARKDGRRADTSDGASHDEHGDDVAAAHMTDPISKMSSAMRYMIFMSKFAYIFPKGGCRKVMCCRAARPTSNLNRKTSKQRYTYHKRLKRQTKRNQRQLPTEGYSGTEGASDSS
ncbi:hypothetical protein CPB85DRAFT_1459735 [Mucidula mucida]|nr:hypothetical protein CPB85DRAFT_1459735 [Mucidula mucida]